MKKLLLVALLSVLGLGNAMAQSSMTDQQIIEYVKKQHEAGKSNNDIATELLKKGVTPERMKQLKAKYEREGKDGALDLTGTTTTKSRREGRTRGHSGVGQRRQAQSTVRSMSHARRQEYNNEQAGLITGNLDEIMPDSMQMFVGGLIDEQPVRRIFGRDIFNNDRLTFEPNENVATPASYQLGAGDVVYIDIFGATQKSIEATISPDGAVVIEGVGPVKVGGMTVSQANSRLQAVLAERYASSQVQLTVGETHTISINVMGEVAVPGTYTLSAFATAFHALYAAGGVNDIGTMRSIMIYRDGRKQAEIDVYDYILHGKTRNDIRLQTGDVIYVGPYFSLVDIEGKVKRPMLYEMKQNETLSTLLGFAGNFAGDAYKQNVRVIRRSGHDYTVYTVEEFDFGAFKLMDGDSITVDSIIARYSNMVEVRGAVYRPGMYQMNGKVNTVRELLQAIDGPTEEALKDRAVIYRMKEDRSREVKSFNLEALMNGTVADIPLRNEDIIQIFDAEETRTSRTLTIYGAVNFPGVYDYADGTSIEDLILQAGGLADNASLRNIEVSHRNIDMLAEEQGLTIATTQSFSLTPGLAVEGDPTFTLQPYDVVFVRNSPVWEDSRVVTVEGEVNFSGEFSLQRKDERLSDIIKRAGGLTQYAYTQGAHLERTMDENELERKKALIRLSQAAADSIDAKTLDISSTYTVSINLEKAIANPGSMYDVVLTNGDRLVIPEMQNLVKVNGAVMYPNAIAWQKGKKAKFYIENAGGYSTKAKKNKTFVINLNGTVQRANKVKEIQPGSEIVVPTRSERRRMSVAEIATLGTSTASLATMIATIANIIAK